MPLDSSLYVLRTCTRSCSSETDCTAPQGDGGVPVLIYGSCIATPGCASTCGFPPPDAGADAAPDGPYVPPGDAGCVTPYNPGLVACGGGQCNTEFQMCCIDTSTPYCSSCTCAGVGVSISCDGPEDCDAGQACAAGACTAASSCDYALLDSTTVSSCVCHSAADCPATFPYCYQLAGNGVHCQSVPPSADAGVTPARAAPARARATSESRAGAEAARRRRRSAASPATAISTRRHARRDRPGLAVRRWGAAPPSRSSATGPKTAPPESRASRPTRAEAGRRSAGPTEPTAAPSCPTVSCATRQRTARPARPAYRTTRGRSRRASEVPELQRLCKRGLHVVASRSGAWPARWPIGSRWMRTRVGSCHPVRARIAVSLM
jgi:hypothetical protein